MYKFSDHISSVVVEIYLSQITSLSWVRLSDVNFTSKLHLRNSSGLAVVWITTKKLQFNHPTPCLLTNRVLLCFSQIEDIEISKSKTISLENLFAYKSDIFYKIEIKVKQNSVFPAKCYWKV